MKVLVAADSRTMRRIYRSILACAGYAEGEIVEAERGEQVVFWLGYPQSGIDLVVADWDLPGMDGLALLGQVAKVRSLGDVGVIFVVNAPQRPKAQEAVRLGARGFVVRPFQDDDLRDQIRAAGTSLETQRTKQASGLFRAIALAAREESELPFLIHLPSRVISDVFGRAKNERHAAGSTILRAGERVDDLHVLTSGEVEAFEPAQPHAPRVFGAGECFAELALMKGVPSPLTIRARTPVQLARISRPALEELASRHTELRDYLASRVTGGARSTPPRNGSSGNALLSGSLKSLAFADVVQFLQGSGKSGVLSLVEGADRAEIHFDGGEVRHARAGPLEGDRAFYQVALWKQGSFSFDSNGATNGVTIRQPTMTLLMEAMRLADEAKHDTC
jgi:two-component system, chemotaxis family, chemotaxis protein CheY